ncbi:MAG: hypothetical protein NW224_05975 [Leptolyngbyaceae cyanobacterium bins.302]|nr:hypothetical protein [Leptolyngbyaceae cyanobacterium bins.302]
MTYANDLEATKQTYPFNEWHENLEYGLEQYTQENCNKAQTIFDTLIAELIALGIEADESQKIQKFEVAVLALNNLNEELDDCFIETGEREDLCELCNAICRAARIDPSKYGDGEGPASEWREW